MRNKFLPVCCAAVFLGLWIGNARASEITCTFDAMQVDPASVIDPCTKRIADEALPSADRAEAFFVRGRAYARTRQIRSAAQDYDVAIKLAPTRSDLYVSRSSAEFKLNRWREAWEDLSRALTIDPRNVRANRAMGAAYSDAGQVDEALRFFNLALAIDPTEPYALLFRSQLHASAHRFAEALADASALVAIPPEVINKLGYVDGRGALNDFHVVALDHRAQLYEQVGDPNAAGKDLDAALAERRTASTLQVRAENFLRTNRENEALKDLDEAARLDPDDSVIQYNRGLALAGLERYDDGLAAFDQAIASYRTRIVSREQLGFAHLMRARMLRGLGRTDEAVRTLNTAICMSPEVKAATLISLSSGGYWSDLNPSAQSGPAFEAALRACMIDKDCN